MKPAYVYRLFHTVTGQLLYIGVTTNIRQRLAGHRSKAWWPLGEVAVALEGPMHIIEALEIEREAIQNEQPHINNTPAARVLRPLEEMVSARYYPIEEIPGLL